MPVWWSWAHTVFQMQKIQCQTLQWRCQLIKAFELCGTHPLTRVCCTAAMRGLVAIGREAVVTVSLFSGVWGIRQLGTECARFVVYAGAFCCPSVWSCFTAFVVTAFGLVLQPFVVTVFGHVLLPSVLTAFGHVVLLFVVTTFDRSCFTAVCCDNILPCFTAFCCDNIWSCFTAVCCDNIWPFFYSLLLS